MKFYSKIFLLVALLICNIAIINRAWDMSASYPFDRIIIGDTLYQSLLIMKRSPYFLTKISEINNEPITDKKVISKLVSKKNVKTITLKISNNKEHVLVPKDMFNHDLFAFIFFLVFFANIHIIWGLFLETFGSNNVVSKQFSYFLIMFGVLLLLTILSLLMDFQFSIFIILSSVALYFIVVSTAIYMTRFKYKKILYLILNTSSVFSVFAGITVLHFVSMKAYLVMSILIPCFGVLFFLLSIIKRLVIRKTQRNLSALYVTVGGLSLIFPLIGFSISLYCDFPLPISFMMTFSILAPVLIGNNILNNYAFTGNQKKRLHSKIFLDFFSGTILAVVLFFILKNYRNNFNLLLIGLLIALMSAVLFLRRIFIVFLKKNNIDVKDKYISSIQIISEIATQPINFKERLTRIYYELFTTLGISKIFFKFFDSNSSFFDKMLDDDHIGVLSSDSFLYRALMKNEQIIMNNYIFTENVYNKVVSSGEINSDFEVIVPLKFRNDLVGVVCAGPKYNRLSFTADEFLYLKSCGTMIIQMLENEALFKNYIVKGKYERELDVASYVQMRLFPLEFPQNRGISAAYFSRPFIKVTGDYFDFIEIDENKTCMIIGDVAGHGLPAAMIMSITASIFQAMTKESLSLSEIFYELNDFFINRYSGMELITVFCGIFDKRTKTIEYINAGHCNPFIINGRDYKIGQIENKNHIIGVLDDPGYFSSFVQLQSGDELIFYTDGLTEIQDSETNGDVGDAIIYKVLIDKKDVSIEDKIDAFADYIESLGVSNVKDDITIIGMEVL